MSSSRTGAGGTEDITMSATLTDNPYTARITPGGRGYDIVEMVVGPSEDVRNTLHVRHYDGMVTWSSDWAHVHDLIAAGVCGAVHRGPETYGHVDVYFV